MDPGGGSSIHQTPSSTSQPTPPLPRSLTCAHCHSSSPSILFLIQNHTRSYPVCEIPVNIWGWGPHPSDCYSIPIYVSFTCRGPLTTSVTSPFIHSSESSNVFACLFFENKIKYDPGPSVFHTLVITCLISLRPGSSRPVITAVTPLSLQLISTSLLQSPSDHFSLAVVTPT